MTVKYFELVSLVGKFFAAVNECNRLWHSTAKEEGKQKLLKSLAEVTKIVEEIADENKDCTCCCGGCSCCNGTNEDESLSGIRKIVCMVKKEYELI